MDPEGLIRAFFQKSSTVEKVDIFETSSSSEVFLKGWYLDPWKEFTWRYWDQYWTTLVSENSLEPDLPYESSFYEKLDATLVKKSHASLKMAAFEAKDFLKEEKTLQKEQGDEFLPKDSLEEERNESKSDFQKDLTGHSSREEVFFTKGEVVEENHKNDDEQQKHLYSKNLYSKNLRSSGSSDEDEMDKTSAASFLGNLLRPCSHTKDSYASSGARNVETSAPAVSYAFGALFAGLFALGAAGFVSQKLSFPPLLMLCFGQVGLWTPLLIFSLKSSQGLSAYFSCLHKKDFLIAVLFSLTGRSALVFSSLVFAGSSAAVRGGFAADSFFAVLVVFVLTCLLAPVVEEIYFRGLLQTSLLRYGQTIALLGQASVFGLMHYNSSLGEDLLGTIVGLGLFGLLLGVLRLKTKRLVPGMLTHAFFNLTALVFSLL